MSVASAVVAASLTACGSSPSGAVPATATARSSAGPVQPTAQASSAPTAAPARLPIRSTTLQLVDRRRSAGSFGPRRITTLVRYPAPAGGPGPYPLVIFGHGYALTPASYTRLLRAWAQRGYVVAAPTFPLENANAPGGPDESDLVNQPGDMRFVISRLLTADARRRGPLSGLIASRQIAVAGHSDGGDTALAVGYDARYRDPRVRAAVILAGAEIPAVGPFPFPRDGPALMAVQGTADPVNAPSATDVFFHAAHRPKLRLDLLEAGHYDPFFSQQPQLRIVARVTTAFLDRYLKGVPVSPRRLRALGSRAGVSRLRLHL